MFEDDLSRLRRAPYHFVLVTRRKIHPHDISLSVSRQRIARVYQLPVTRSISAQSSSAFLWALSDGGPDICESELSLEERFEIKEITVCDIWKRPREP